MAESLRKTPEPEYRKRVIGEGEKIWNIVRKEYRQLFKENPQLDTNDVIAFLARKSGIADADRISPGDEIRLYTVKMIEKEFPSIAKRRKAKIEKKNELKQLKDGIGYEIVAGDNPDKIARKWGVEAPEDLKSVTKYILQYAKKLMQKKAGDEEEIRDGEIILTIEDIYPKQIIIASMLKERMDRRAKKPVKFDVIMKGSKEEKRIPKEVLKLFPKEYESCMTTDSATITAYVPDNPETALMIHSSREGGAAVDFDTVPPRSIIVIDTYDENGDPIQLKVVADDTGGDMRVAAKAGVCHVDIRYLIKVKEKETREQADARAFAFGRRDKNATVYIFVPKDVREFYKSAVPQTKPKKKGVQTQPRKTAPKKKPQKRASPEKKKRTYKIVEGDTLGSIAQKTLGKASYWRLIMKANPNIIKDENKIPVGKEIVIPPKPKPKSKPRPKGIPEEKILDALEKKERLTKKDMEEINKLDEKFRQFVIRLLKRARAAGMKVTIKEGVRTYATQLEYFKRGRSFNKKKGVWKKVGKTVTDARPGYSWHQFGYAVDIVAENKKGKPYYPPDNDVFWKKLGWIGKSFEIEIDGVKEKLTWGGTDFTTIVDCPHFQWRPKGVTREKLRLAKAKKKKSLNT